MYVLLNLANSGVINDGDEDNNSSDDDNTLRHFLFSLLLGQSIKERTQRCHSW